MKQTGCFEHAEQKIKIQNMRAEMKESKVNRKMQKR